jgi:hypothetical protein
LGALLVAMINIKYIGKIIFFLLSNYTMIIKNMVTFAKILRAVDLKDVKSVLKKFNVEVGVEESIEPLIFQIAD